MRLSPQDLLSGILSVGAFTMIAVAATVPDSKAIAADPMEFTGFSSHAQRLDPSIILPTASMNLDKPANSGLKGDAAVKAWDAFSQVGIISTASLGKAADKIGRAHV